MSSADEAPRVAVVTGAGAGIGRAVARKLLGLGHTVVLVGRHADSLESVASLEGTAPGQSIPYQCDVTDSARVSALFRYVEAELGRLDFLFNNVGAGSSVVPIDEVGDDSWDHLVAANLTSAFYCTREALRLMKEQEPQGGRILNNGSVSAQVPRPFTVGYAAAKHGLSGLTKSTAIEGRSFHVCCGQIDIGNAATQLSTRVSTGAPQADGSVATEPRIDPVHIAELVGVIAELPLDVNVPHLTMMANEMPFMARG